MLGDCDDKYFTEDEPKAIIDRFHARLKEAKDQMKERNENLDIPYIAMVPGEEPVYPPLKRVGPVAEEVEQEEPIRAQDDSSSQLYVSPVDGENLPESGETKLDDKKDERSGGLFGFLRRKPDSEKDAQGSAVDEKGTGEMEVGEADGLQEQEQITPEVAQEQESVQPILYVSIDISRCFC